MKIEFLTESTFGTYKNKTSQDAKKERVKQETAKISRAAARKEIAKFYGKVLELFALRSKPLSKGVNTTRWDGFTFNAATIFDTTEDSNWYGGTNINKDYAHTDYENIAESLYGSQEMLSSSHSTMLIPFMIIGSSNIIEKSLLGDGVNFTKAIKIFADCVNIVEQQIGLPIGFTKPKEYKLLLLPRAKVNSWTNAGDDVTEIYDSVFKGTYNNSIDSIINATGYTDNDKSPYLLYIWFNDKIGYTSSNALVLDSSSFKKLLQQYNKLVYNPLYWKQLEIITLYKNSDKPEFYKFLEECNQVAKITNIEFKDEEGNNITWEEKLLIIQKFDTVVNNTISILNNVNKLKEKLPFLIGTNIEVPNLFYAKGFMVNFDSKFLAYKPEQRRMTTIGKNIGLAEPQGKFVRNIYALDLGSSSVRNDVTKMIVNGIAKEGKIDLKGKYYKTIIDMLIENMMTTFEKLLKLRPHCCIGNNLLFCSYTQGESLENIFRIEFNQLELNLKKGTIRLWIGYDFKLACAQGFNGNYRNTHSQSNAGKSYEYISGKKVRIEIPI